MVEIRSAMILQVSPGKIRQLHHLGSTFGIIWASRDMLAQKPAGCESFFSNVSGPVSPYLKYQAAYGWAKSP